VDEGAVSAKRGADVHGDREFINAIREVLGLAPFGTAEACEEKYRS